MWSKLANFLQTAKFIYISNDLATDHLTDIWRCTMKSVIMTLTMPAIIQNNKVLDRYEEVINRFYW